MKVTDSKELQPKKIKRRYFLVLIIGIAVGAFIGYKVHQPEVIEPVIIEKFVEKESSWDELRELRRDLEKCQKQLEGIRFGLPKHGQPMLKKTP